MIGFRRQMSDLKDLLHAIYTNNSEEEIAFVWSQMMQILERESDNGLNSSRSKAGLWDSSSAVLITYADSVYRDGQVGLETLSEVMSSQIGELTSIIHILPFLCSTSDKGFAVSSHEKIDPSFGDWKHIKELSKKHLLMADLVLNHVSSSHPWVQQFKRSESPGKSYILTATEDPCWNNVFRPRNSSLFTSLNTREGKRIVWTTFSPDQIDLDWHDPNLTVEFLKLLLRYVDSGIDWIRLDAVGFIWKEAWTSCLNRDQAHKLIKLLRHQLNKLSGSGVIISETNVPEKENLSYIETGDEAHLAYNFPLPPLLLEAIFSNQSDLINKWLGNWPELPKQTSFLNFSASHDGVGLRPLEGLINRKRFTSMLVNCEKKGGLISHRSTSGGKEEPYELNISWWSAMQDDSSEPGNLQIERFLLTQLFVMSLKGIPAFYLQAIIACENDTKSFHRTGQRRDLNRGKLDAELLFNQLEDPTSIQNRVLNFLNHAMCVRRNNSAFHPDSPMKCLSKERDDIVAILRGKEKEKILALHNFKNKVVTLDLRDLYGEKDDKFKKQLLGRNSLGNNAIGTSNITLNPFSVIWLK